MFNLIILPTLKHFQKFLLLYSELYYPFKLYVFFKPKSKRGILYLSSYHLLPNLVKVPFISTVVHTVKVTENV